VWPLQGLIVGRLDLPEPTPGSTVTMIHLDNRCSVSAVRTPWATHTWLRACAKRAFLMAR